MRPIKLLMMIALMLSTIAVNADDKLYCVIDISAGPDAVHYPISYLSDVPKGGWSDEYKTTKIVLRKVEAGTFKMCGVANVTISKPYYIGVFAVTKRQYYLVNGKEVNYFYNKRGTYFNEDWSLLPETHVTYNEVRGMNKGALWPTSAEVDEESFIGKLRAKVGFEGIDLPTEAQWELGHSSLCQWRIGCR